MDVHLQFDLTIRQDEQGQRAIQQLQNCEGLKEATYW